MIRPPLPKTYIQAAQRPRAQLPGGPGIGSSILALFGRHVISNLPHASRVSCSERLCENPEFANRVPTSTPRAWGAHADRPHFLLPSMPFLGWRPTGPRFHTVWRVVRRARRLVVVHHCLLEPGLDKLGKRYRDFGRRGFGAHEPQADDCFVVSPEDSRRVKAATVPGNRP